MELEHPESRKKGLLGYQAARTDCLPESGRGKTARNKKSRKALPVLRVVAEWGWCVQVRIAWELE